MTNERREEVVLAALVVSLAVHISLMVLVRPQVMTHALTATKKVDRGVQMKVVRSKPMPDPVKIEEILDLKAAQDAPEVARVLLSQQAPMIVTSTASPVMPDAPTMSLPEMPVPVFEAKLAGEGDAAQAETKIMRIETPKAPTAEQSVPSISRQPGDVAIVPVVPAAPAEFRAPEAAPLPVKLPDAKADKQAPFTPAKEVYESVDEKIVAAEKSAVRKMVNAVQAEDLARYVDMAMSATVSGDWRYFRVRLTPRTTLKTIPKDVVMLVDGSGSIGNDRLSSCRKAAKQILRSCTNTGDRFNLVVFRNAFTYAFRTWQECDAPSFAACDEWLSKQTAHGRTDVFSTISSVLTLPRDPTRPLIAMVVTDGDANCGVSDTSEIISKFTALNDGLVSVYMYGVKATSNRELIDVLTHGNRGESFVFDGWRWNAGTSMETLAERFRDPVLSDLRLIFASGVEVDAYPRLLRNLYRGETLEFVGRIPSSAADVAFSLKGINGSIAYEGFFRLPFSEASEEADAVSAWTKEAALDRRF